MLCCLDCGNLISLVAQQCKEEAAAVRSMLRLHLLATCQVAVSGRVKADSCGGLATC